MKTYNSNIENGIKSALFSLEDLILTEKVKDSQLFTILAQLEKQVERSQNAEMENTPSD